MRSGDRVSVRSATLDTTLSARMSTAIGTAVATPPIPTSGAASAPNRNWLTPITADALPAASACADRASAVVFGSTTPMLATVRNSGGRNTARLCVPETTAANRPSAPTRWTTRKAPSSDRGPKRLSSKAFS